MRDIEHVNFLQQCVALPGHIFVALDLQGKILFLSEFGQEILKIDNQDLSSINWFDTFISPEDRDSVKQIFDNIIAGKLEDYRCVESSLRTPDGDKINVLWTNAGLFDPKGNLIGTVSSGIEITSYNDETALLKVKELHLQKIFEILPIGLWFADKNGTLKMGNPAGIKIWGAEPHVSPSDYGVFKAWKLPSHKEVKAQDWALYHTITKGITVKDELLEIEAFDGKKKIIYNYTAPVKDNYDQIIGAIIVNRDVTEEHNLQQSLQISQERFELVINATQDGIYDWNLITGEIYYSPRWCSMLGYSPQEIQGDIGQWKKLTHPEDAQKTLLLVQKMIKGETDRIEVEFRMLHKEGHWLDILSRALLVRDQNDQPARIVGSHVDISELNLYRNHLQELVDSRTKELEEKNKQLKRYNKLFIGREFRIKELRDQIKDLKKQLNKQK